jgi:hypothetical protein
VTGLDKEMSRHLEENIFIFFMGFGVDLLCEFDYRFKVGINLLFLERL